MFPMFPAVPLEVLESDTVLRLRRHPLQRGGVQSNPLARPTSCNVHHNSSDIPSQSVRLPHIVCRASELGSGDVRHPLPLGSEHWMLMLVPQNIAALGGGVLGWRTGSETQSLTLER